MVQALVFDPDAVTRAALTEQLRALEVDAVACGTAGDARWALTVRLFDLVLYSHRPRSVGEPAPSATTRLLDELAACPTPLVALADRSVSAATAPAAPVQGVTAWLPLRPSLEELADTVRRHALMGGYRRPAEASGGRLH